MNKPWCIPFFAILILVFTFWETNASFWIVWIAAVLIFVRSLTLFSLKCNVKKKISNKKKK